MISHNDTEQKKPRIIILGGGFAGIRTALSLLRTCGDRIALTLISDRSDFHYYPGLHRIVGGHDATICSIPLEKIFHGYDISIIQDTITELDLAKKVITGKHGNEYHAEYLVLGLGSETEYFNIQGLAEASFNLQSVEGGERLRDHFKKLFALHANADREEKVVGLHITVVGAGPAGVDLAGEIAVFTKKLAHLHHIPESYVTVDIVEAGERLLAMMHPRVSELAEKRLRKLGVNVYLNRDLIKEGSWTIYLKDMTIGAKTLIWTAGVKANALYKSVPNLTFGRKGRIVVDEYLQPTGYPDVFAVGDSADTQYAGLAQTALHDGRFVSEVIMSRITETPPPPAYIPKPVAYNIGVGPHWSIMVLGKVIIHGRIASWMRTLIDMMFFVSILPVREVWKLYTPFKK